MSDFSDFSEIFNDNMLYEMDVNYLLKQILYPGLQNPCSEITSASTETSLFDSILKDSDGNNIDNTCDDIIFE